MSDQDQSNGITIKAVRPVGYFVSLLQSVGRVVVSGAALFGVLMVGAMSWEKIDQTERFDGLLSGKADEEGDKDWVHVAGSEDSENKLLVLDLAGVILGTPPWPAQDAYYYTVQDVTYGYQLRDQIIAAAEDESIKGILIHTRTPGGTIFGSTAIHEGIVEYRKKTGQPVVVWVEGLSASGGVYATAAASAIYAAPGSAVGSIGVIGGSKIFYNKPTAFQSGLFDSGVVTDGGIEVSWLHAGRGKDAGNPFRRLTEEEVRLRQTDLNRSYQVFVNHVAAGRGMDPEKIKNEIGAHIYGNFQAQTYGLIDATLGREAAYDALAELALLNAGDFSIVRKTPPDGVSFNDLKSEDETEKVLFKQAQVRVALEKCSIAQHTILVFHGNVARLCKP